MKPSHNHAQMKAESRAVGNALVGGWGSRSTSIRDDKANLRLRGTPASFFARLVSTRAGLSRSAHFSEGSR